MTIEQATVLDGRYRLGELLGRGGMADVYRSTDELLGRTVAVKVLREVSDPVYRERFIAEARTLAGLNHPSLVTLLDAGILGDRPYLVMGLAEGPTLSERIAAGPLDPVEVNAIGTQLAQALAYAHDQEVVHRDVKPGNVLFSGDGRVLLADFGIARLVGSNEHHTKPGDAIGSPAYLAPEQVAGEALTPAADLFSLGLVLLEALTGTRAFPGSAVEAAMARLSAAPPMPTSLEPGWRALLARMTHRDPTARPTAADVAAELAATTAADGAPAVPASASVSGSVMGPDYGSAVGPDSGLTGETTMESALLSAGPQEQEATYRVEPVPTRRRFWVLTGTAVVALAILGALLTSGLSGAETTDREPGAPVPSGVPTRFQEPLTELHEAIGGDAR